MNQKRRTWRPLASIIILAVGVITVIWLWPEVQRQQRYLGTAMTLIIASVIAFGWFLFFGPMKLAHRAIVFLGAIVVVVGLASAFRIRGVTGDLVPILEGRWKSKTPVAESQPPSSESASPGVQSNATSFPQFYGPNRNATVDNVALATNWSLHPPKVLWKQAIGPAWSGFAIQGNWAVTQEQNGDSELVTCYELQTGRRVWTHSDTARFANTIAGEGPRATPTLTSNRVYAFGATGILNCLDLATGRKVWSQNAGRDNGGKLPEWGFSSSPLLVDDKVIVSVGGSEGRSLVAYGSADGQFLWGSGTRGAGYSSPIEATLLGTRQILYFSTDAILAFGLDGTALWEHPWKRDQPKVSLPVVIGTNQVLISSGYGAGCELIEISRSTSPAGANSGWKAESVWKSMALKSKFAPIFVKDDYIYGLDDGIFTCVDLKTGQRRWKDGRYGHGQGLLVSGLILLTSEAGEIILLQPDPAELIEIGRIQVLNDKTWNPPALAGEYLIMRNDVEAACLKLSLNAEATRNVALSFANRFSRR